MVSQNYVAILIHSGLSALQINFHTIQRASPVFLHSVPSELIFALVFSILFVPGAKEKLKRIFGLKDDFIT